ncbi:MAG TPA: four helix bundle protein [Gemmatimonadales bacterium]|jgi:four helix bundle protein
MAALVRFEDLKVWRRARDLAGRIYTMTASPPLTRDFGLKDQLRRAAVSVMSNIAEGFESNSNRSFFRYLRIAKSSLAELRSQLYVAADTGMISGATHYQILTRVEELSRMLGGLIKALDRGLKRTTP